MTGSDSDIGKILEESFLARENELRELRAQPLNLPPFGKIFIPSLEEVHRSFLTPLELIEMMSLSTRELAVTQIHRELMSGRIKGLCEEAHIAVGDVLGRPKWVELDSWIWRLSAPSTDADFWETGYFKIEIPATVGRSGIQGSFELFGVRFSSRSSSEPDNATIAQEATKPTVGRNDLGRWFEVFSSVHPDAVEDFALRSASAMFPDNHVPRQWVRDLRGPQKRGKPAKRHD